MKNFFLKTLLFIFISGCITSALAAIYKIKNPDGSISFSDQPTEKAKEIKLQPANISYPSGVTSDNNVNQDEKKADKTAQTNDENEQAVTEKKAPEYNLLKISSPTEKQTFQNQPNITVSVVIDPALFPGNKIQAYVDGKPFGAASTTTTIPLNGLERGTHSVEVRVLDAKGYTLKSSPSVTFYIHQVSLNSPQSKKPLTPLTTP